MDVGMPVGAVGVDMCAGNPTEGVSRTVLLAPPVRELLEGRREDVAKNFPLVGSLGANGVPNRGVG